MNLRCSLADNKYNCNFIHNENVKDDKTENKIVHVYFLIICFIFIKQIIKKK